MDADKAEAEAAQQLQAEEEALRAAKVQKEKDDLHQEECKKKKNRANSCPSLTSLYHREHQLLPLSQ